MSKAKPGLQERLVLESERDAARARVVELEQQLEAAGAVARRQELELQQLRAQLARPRLVPVKARTGTPAPADEAVERPQDEPAEIPEATEPEEAVELTELERDIAERKQKLANRRRGR